MKEATPRPVRRGRAASTIDPAAFPFEATGLFVRLRGKIFVSSFFVWRDIRLLFLCVCVCVRARASKHARYLVYIFNFTMFRIGRVFCVS